MGSLCLDTRVDLAWCAHVAGVDLTVYSAHMCSVCVCVCVSPGSVYVCVKCQVFSQPGSCPQLMTD